MTLLEKIKGPADLKKLAEQEIEILAGEIREKIMAVVATNGGHLSPNLGVVELTLALHKIFDFSHDKIVWDVGHQCYTHKLITGRYEQFDTLRREGGICGFPRREESEYDHFDTGHAGTSTRRLPSSSGNWPIAPTFAWLAIAGQARSSCWHHRRCTLP